MNTIYIILIVCLSIFCVPFVLIHFSIVLIFNLLYFFIVVVRYRKFPLHETRVTFKKFLCYGSIFLAVNFLIISGLYCFAISLVGASLVSWYVYVEIKDRINTEKRYNNYVSNNRVVDEELNEEEIVQFCDNSDRLHSDSGRIFEKYGGQYRKLNEEMLLWSGYKSHVLYSMEKREVVKSLNKVSKRKDTIEKRGIYGFQEINEGFSFYSDGENACIISNYDGSIHKVLSRDLIYMESSEEDKYAPLGIRVRMPKRANGRIFYFRRYSPKEIMYIFYDTKDFEEKSRYVIPVVHKLDQTKPEYWFYDYLYLSFDFVMGNGIFVHISHNKVISYDAKKFKEVKKESHDEFPILRGKSSSGDFIFGVLAMEYVKKCDITPDISCFFGDDHMQDRERIEHIDYYDYHIAVIGNSGECLVFQINNSYTNVDFVRKTSNVKNFSRFLGYSSPYLMKKLHMFTSSTKEGMCSIKIENLVTKKFQIFSTKNIQNIEEIRSPENEPWILCRFREHDVNVVKRKKEHLKKGGIVIMSFSESEGKMSLETRLIFKGDVKGVSIFSNRLIVLQLHKKFIVWEISYLKELKYFMCLVWERNGLVREVLRYRILPYVNPMWFYDKVWKNSMRESPNYNL